MIKKAKLGLVSIISASIAAVAAIAITSECSPTIETRVDIDSKEGRAYFCAQRLSNIQQTKKSYAIYIGEGGKRIYLSPVSPDTAFYYSQQEGIGAVIPWRNGDIREIPLCENYQQPVNVERTSEGFEVTGFKENISR